MFLLSIVSADYQIMDENEKASSRKKLYTRMRLWEFSDKYIVEPVDGIADSYLSMSRIDGSLTLIGMLSFDMLPCPSCLFVESDIARMLSIFTF